ncbi:Zn-dependent aminopeptidase [Planctomycetales bacterium 10988]|nr:Zn-dependent aminopeptidase [Planctomycetales bacterium 10988]
MSGAISKPQDLTGSYIEDPFRQMEEILPTPTATRTASGAPGPGYWQQRADYKIEVELDDEKQRILGSERIRYQNLSPHTLTYLWLQLEPNLFQPNSDATLSETSPSFESLSFSAVRRLLAQKTFEGGVKLTKVGESQGNELNYRVVKTMLRVDLPQPLAPEQKFDLHIDWNYQIPDQSLMGGRSGYEYFEEDKNYLYEIAQWFPRMAAYSDATGWQHKQFLGRGEFTLELGNYEVAITVPSDHIVAATGVLKNPTEVLSNEQQDRFTQAKTAEKPVFIVTPEEAKKNEASRSKQKKTWKFSAKNVRDFAFASSRKFIWDAQGHPLDDRTVMAMSFYPNEGEPLWSQYSTRSIIHTINVYSKFTFDYPYPVAISVNGPVYGMEYPMICFNGPRPEDDGTYSKRTKYGLISVIIHEVGHNWFPMIVNSDERQWTWMDEGLNTFLQYLAEQEWEEDYPSWRGEPENIVTYMRSSDQVPIMTNSESILQFGNNAYGKPATGLNILRETILGRELFDLAFKEYANRWKFKRPMPADLFRTMEDASGIDLDWFWRGWFYTTFHTDIAIEKVELYQINTKDPEIENPKKKEREEETKQNISKERNQELPKFIEQYPELRDFYNEFDEYAVTDADREAYQKFLKGLEEKEKAVLERTENFYVLHLKNLGGLVMPILLQIEYEDDTEEMIRIPAEIWVRNPKSIKKLLITDKAVRQLEIDPKRETADTDRSNNYYPPRIVPTRFELFKRKTQKNEMQKAKEAEEKANKKKQETASTEKEEKAEAEE